MAARRWRCPICDSGVLAPSRPRKDDVRRYCLKCSQETGRLVERTCPALEKRRGEKRAARTVARKRDRDRAAEKERQWPTVLNSIFARAKKLRCWKDDVRHATLEIRRRKDEHSSGHAWDGGRITVTAGHDAANAIETLVHELAHVCCMMRGSDDGHGGRFRFALLEATKELIGADRLDGFKAPANHCYEIDHDLVPLYRQAVWDGVFGDVELMNPPPEKKEERPDPDLPPGTIRFNIPDTVWMACRYDERDTTGSPGLSPSTWAALQGAARHRTGRSFTSVVTASLASAEEIAKDVEYHNHLEGARAIDACAEKIRAAIAAARK